MERLARGAQPQHKQPHLGQGPIQPHPQLTEVDLGLLAGWVDLGHGHTCNPTGQFSPQLGDVAADGGLAQLGAVAIDQPLPDPPGGMPLLLGEHLVGGYPRADQRLPSAQAPAPLVPNVSARAAPPTSAPGGPSADAPGRSGPRHGCPSVGGGHPGGYSRTAPPSTSLLPCSAGVIDREA